MDSTRHCWRLKQGHSSRVGAVYIAAAAHGVARAIEDRPLFDLAEELNAADHLFQAAASKLSRAERKLAHIEETSIVRDLPEWFLSCEESEAAARATIESLYERIVEVPARSKAGLAIKLWLLGTLYSEDPTKVQDEGDVDTASRLLRSIIDDISGGRPLAAINWCNR